MAIREATDGPRWYPAPVVRQAATEPDARNREPAETAMALSRLWSVFTVHSSELVILGSVYAVRMAQSDGVEIHLLRGVAALSFAVSGPNAGAMTNVR